MTRNLGGSRLYKAKWTQSDPNSASARQEQSLYQATPDSLSNDVVVVEADGFGGATTRVVEGNFPVDYCAKCEKSFETEREAEQAAQQIVDNKLSAALVLGTVPAQVT
jgi:hypothetical protein